IASVKADRYVVLTISYVAWEGCFLHMSKILSVNVDVVELTRSPMEVEKASEINNVSSLVINSIKMLLVDQVSSHFDIVCDIWGTK
ncbi:hypothetical protein DRH29_05985, partial [candidate division Kazan bacterium]